MTEHQVQRPREHSTGGPGVFGDDPFSLQSATVQHLTHVARLPIVGMTVGSIRVRFRDRLDIPAQSTAVLDGQPVSDDAVIGANQVLIFTGRAGERGSRGSCRPCR
jgi:hypothetical protein